MEKKKKAQTLLLHSLLKVLFFSFSLLCFSMPCSYHMKRRKHRRRRRGGAFRVGGGVSSGGKIRIPGAPGSMPFHHYNPPGGMTFSGRRTGGAFNLKFKTALPPPGAIPKQIYQMGKNTIGAVRQRIKGGALNRLLPFKSPNELMQNLHGTASSAQETAKNWIKNEMERVKNIPQQYRSRSDGWIPDSIRKLAYGGSFRRRRRRHKR